MKAELVNLDGWNRLNTSAANITSGQPLKKTA
nr:hypothetical protein [Mucilaginibacter sp. FT3.2]